MAPLRAPGERRRAADAGGGQLTLELVRPSGRWHFVPSTSPISHDGRTAFALRPGRAATDVPLGFWHSHTAARPSPGTWLEHLFSHPLRHLSASRLSSPCTRVRSGRTSRLLRCC